MDRFIPMYIRQSVSKLAGTVITAEEWNMLFNLNIQQGDHNSEYLHDLDNYLFGDSTAAEPTTGIIPELQNRLDNLSLNELTNVEITDVKNGDFLKYDAAKGKFTNQESGGLNVHWSDILLKPFAQLDEDIFEVTSDGTLSLTFAPVKSVNNEVPDINGNVTVSRVAWADDLVSEDAQTSTETYFERTTGGSASISDGDAWLSRIEGNTVRVGYVQENFSGLTSPSYINYALNESAFKEAVSETSGTYTFNYANGAWSPELSGYGIVASGIREESISHTTSEDITCDVDASVFSEKISKVDGTYTFTYDGSNWNLNSESVDLEEYGITVSGTPVTDDYIAVTYVAATTTATITVNYIAENPGVLQSATPTKFMSTGWNLYEKTNGYAKLVANNTYCILGTYTALSFKKTLESEAEEITPVDGFFALTESGYVVVEGADNDTCIFLPWSDWISGPDLPFEDYTESVVTLPITDVSGNPLPYMLYGLCSVGTVRDILDFDTLRYTSNIERIVNTEQHMEDIIASGRQYIFDVNYIYAVRETPVYYTLSATIDTNFKASDHGLEFLLGTSIPAVVTTLYGQNLKDKLRVDVLSLSAQTLTKSQQIQAKKNLGIEGATYYTVPSTAWVSTTNDDLSFLNSNILAEFGIASEIALTDIPYIAKIQCTDFANSSKPIAEFAKITANNITLRSIVQYVYFTDTHILLYASEQPTVSGVLSVKGV